MTLLDAYVVPTEHDTSEFGISSPNKTKQQCGYADGLGIPFDFTAKPVVAPPAAAARDAKEKKATMELYWVPGVNNLKQYGRWALAEFGDVFQVQEDFRQRVAAEFQRLIEQATGDTALVPV
ncbi:MAG: restriction endonuclease [Hydrocarboniphaga sp.]|nr:hypothetical protein [Hydrocarboniphaga sp.]MDB5969318.1 restriction endonuclease [Hydrocarboniphaga sp.]